MTHPETSPLSERLATVWSLRHRTVTTADGVELAVVEAGDPEATPVVLLHGLASSWRSWSGVLADPQLSSQYRLIAFDLRGHGDSPAPLDPDQSTAATPSAFLQLWVQDLRAVLADLPPRHLVGGSFGSTIVQGWLQTGEDDGSTLSATLVAGPNVLGPVPADDPAARLLGPEGFAALVGAASGGDRVYADVVLARGPADTTAGSELTAEVAAIAAGTLPEAVVAALSATFDHREFLAALPVERRERLNVLVCEQDQLFDTTAMLTCWRQSGIDADVVPGEGHAFWLRDPARFASTLLGLLSAPARGSAELVG